MMQDKTGQQRMWRRAKQRKMDGARSLQFLHHFPRHVYPVGEIRKTTRFLQTLLFGKRNPAQIQQFDMDDFTRKGILQNCRN
ncbi:hypothetical protein DOE73_29530, partial [Paenibacillus dendritiformis]